ncbi:B2 bradykinin receptor-like [Astatotilapia calliptera]|uniref:B2 bradykinin receptor-like n=1 Tax=Astatotilapia calliptera TaxID=8154 RepID=UPI000E4199FC|nr:B2 bradykinin receptor-like [Astatotilapia calliptera]
MTGNQSNASEEHCFVDNDFILAPVYVICLLAIIFNVFVLMVFCLHKKACTVTEIYLSNLTGTQLLLVCCLPFWVDDARFSNDWPFSESLCKLIPAVIRMCTCCNIYFLVLASLDCYVALVHPLFHELMSRPFYAKLGCLFVWSFGLVFALPIFIYSKVKLNPQSNITECMDDYTSLDQYLLYEVRNILFNFIIPAIIILFCSVRIITILRKKRMGFLKPQRTEQKTTTLILAVVLSCLICRVIFCMKILVVENTDIQKCHIMLEIINLVCVYLSFFDTVLNPILNIIIGKSFRNRTKEFFKQ